MTSPSQLSVDDFDANDAPGLFAVRELLDRCHALDGRPPLGDHALSAQTHPLLGARSFVVRDRALDLVAYAQATPTTEPVPVWTVDIAVDPGSRGHSESILGAAWVAVLGWLGQRDNAGVQWWCHEATATERGIAEQHGLLAMRQLLEMHTPLALTSSAPPLATRPFVVGVDDSALLEVNNLAFVHHADQGNWTSETLQARFASDWFDPAGLLAHVDGDGSMLGFCWTKIHRSPDAPVGEIYVLAVRPTHHGCGLGRGLAEAGLHSLRARGVEQAMLFVDAANTPALALYQQLGFRVASTTTAFGSTNRER